MAPLLTHRTTAPRRVDLWLAFGALYLLWGSTYLGIRIAAETLPPFLMAGARFTVAGGLLLLWGILCGKRLPTARQWLGAAGVGFCMVTLSNGPVTWAEQRLPSGIVSLFAASTPLLIALFNRWRLQERLGRVRGVGLLLGTAGLLLLGGATFAATPEPWRIAGLLLATTAWAFGSTWGRDWPHADDIMTASSAQMLAGGLITIVVAGVMGEFGALTPAAFASRSLWAWGYLTVFGSMIGFSLFQWLMAHVNATAVSSYTYVNPVVALALGALLAGEAISSRVIFAVLLLIPAVVIVVLGAPARATPLNPDDDAAAAPEVPR